MMRWQTMLVMGSSADIIFSSLGDVGSVATHQPQLSNLTAAKPKKKKTGLCRFYGTKNGEDWLFLS